MDKKKILLILSNIFLVLTLCGVVFVLFSETASAGFAVIPMLFYMICSGAYRTYVNKENK